MIGTNVEKDVAERRTLALLCVAGLILAAHSSGVSAREVSMGSEEHIANGTIARCATARLLNSLSGLDEGALVGLDLRRPRGTRAGGLRPADHQGREGEGDQEEQARHPLGASVAPARGPPERGLGLGELGQGLPVAAGGAGA